MVKKEKADVSKDAVLNLEAIDEVSGDEVSEVEEIEDVPERMPEWTPKTELGRAVKNGEITSITQILDNGYKIMESEIVDYLVPDLKSELIYIGQAKGKFGGGKRIAFKKVQTKTAEGNKQYFVSMAVVGNGKGIVGIGYAKSRENISARDKAIRNAKLNVIHVPLGCGSWECDCGGTHSIPFKTEGKRGSVEVTLFPAPKGTGLVAEKELAKILSFAGIKDVRAKIRGTTKTKTNMVFAAFDALRNMSQIRTTEKTGLKLKFV